MPQLVHFLGKDITVLAKAIRKYLDIPTTGGGVAGDVTSAEVAAIASVITSVVATHTAQIAANSADVTSAKNAVSVLSVVVSNLTSAHNVVSAAQASLVSDVGRISLNLSAVSTRMDAISTVASNATSIANAVSVAHASLVSDIGRISLNASAMSTKIDVTSNALSIEISARNALSVIVSNLNSAHNALSTRHDTISNNVSVISAGLGGVQMKVVAGNQTLFSAATKLSGLSLSVAAAGVYQLEGMIMYTTSATSGTVGFAISTSAATFVNATYRWLGNLSNGTGAGGLSTSATGAGYGNETGVGAYTYSVSAIAAGNVHTELKGLFVISTAGGSLQLKGKNGGDMIIKAGSYLRAFKLA